MSAAVISPPAIAHANGSAKPGHSVRHDPSGVLNRLLTSNAQWASDVARVEPKFFEESAKGQAPKVSPYPSLGASPSAEKLRCPKASCTLRTRRADRIRRSCG